MLSFADVIDELGGYLAVAEALSVPKGTVSAMKTRDSIPPLYWADIATMARRLGKNSITVETLADLKKRKRAGAEVMPLGKAAA